MEQSNLYNQIDLSVGLVKLSDHQSVPRPGLLLSIGSSRRKTERHERHGQHERDISLPTTYGFNFGTWFIYNPATNTGGDGITHPNSRITLGAVIDGTSNTLLSAEVCAWGAVYPQRWASIHECADQRG